MNFSRSRMGLISETDAHARDAAETLRLRSASL